MEHIEGHFTAVRDDKFYYQAWLPDGDCKAAILIVHGLGEHCGRYGNVVDYLVSRGYALYGFDLYGHGKSDGKREFVKSMADYTDTITQYKEMIQEWQPDKPLFILGHSMGGLLVPFYLLDYPEDFRGAVISAPAIEVPPGITKATIAAGKVLSKLAPKAGVMQLDANGVSKDPEVVKAYVNDPLVFHGKTSARLSAEMLDAMMRVNNEMGKIKLPVLILQGSEDFMADPQGAKSLHANVGSEDNTLKIYEGLYHEIFNEPEREQVLSDVAAWLDAHL